MKLNDLACTGCGKVLGNVNLLAPSRGDMLLMAWLMLTHRCWCRSWATRLVGAYKSLRVWGLMVWYGVR